MAQFDVSKNWVLLAGPLAKNAALELAQYLALLRTRAGLGKIPVPIRDSGEDSPYESSPVIILSAARESLERGGFSWRAGADRIELSGDSVRGLWNGVFDFLSALGFAWPQPGTEEAPEALVSLAVTGAAKADAAYPLKTDQANCPSQSGDPRKRRRLVIAAKTGSKEREKLVRWAARNKYDALVFSLREKSVWARAAKGRRLYGADRYALILEAGGCDMRALLPRRLFVFHKDLFRMESGRRVKKPHFCPTNPQTTVRVAVRAGRLFGRAARGMTALAQAAQIPPPVRVFHLWPEKGSENIWCACPACRAFSPAEQNRIAVNTAAVSLPVIDSAALLSFWEAGGEADKEAIAGIVPRGNMFVIN